MLRFVCPYLNSDVELSEEREEHIQYRHPELLPEYRNLIEQTLASPDQIRRSNRFKDAKMFSRWYNNVLNGKHIVVVVVSEREPNQRHWIITAYITKKLAGGEIEWNRP